MNLYLVVCRECGKEILNLDTVRRTSAGKIMCDECSPEGSTEMPLN